MSTTIKVEGLAEFKRNLKKLDSDLPKALRIGLNEAAELVAEGTRLGMPRRSGRARGSVKARSTQTKARVREGSNRAPYVPWLDFGGRVGKRNSVFRSSPADGRYLYPAFFRTRDSGEIQEALSKALINVARSAGVEMS